MMPFWYFLNQVNKNQTDFDRSFYWDFYRTYRGSDHLNSWYRQGFQETNDGYLFDPWAAVNLYKGYIAVPPPTQKSSSGGYLRPDSGVHATGGGQSRNEPVLSICNGGECIRQGDIFLGCQDRNPLTSPWTYACAGWQHAAIKTRGGFFMEAPKMGKPVAENEWSVVTGFYHRKQAYLTVKNVTDYQRQQAAGWAKKQEKKPYSLIPMDSQPQWMVPNPSAKYKGFYCSVLVWAAWYHSSSGTVRLAQSNYYGAPEIDFITYMSPNVFWRDTYDSGYKPATLSVVAEMSNI